MQQDGLGPCRRIGGCQVCILLHLHSYLPNLLSAPPLVVSPTAVDPDMMDISVPFDRYPLINACDKCRDQ